MDELLTIPMTGHVQSLNASVAAGLLMYQAFSQRQGVDHEKQLLIVDGYNMIGSWRNLSSLKAGQNGGCKRSSLHRLSNYAKYEGMEVIVVFDAQLVPGIQQNYKKYQLDVVFTKEDETADSYIERIAGQLNDRLTQVTVATSDLAEQWMIFSQGALRTSAYELYKTIKTEKQ